MYSQGCNQASQRETFTWCLAIGADTRFRITHLERSPMFVHALALSMRRVLQ